MEKLTKNTENGLELAETEKTANELIWEDNHQKLAAAIANYVAEYGSMPNKGYLAEATGLSRETVYKHIKAFAESPNDKSILAGINIMTEHVVASVLRAALQGDLHAAKLFLQNTKSLNTPKQMQQNDFVQINKTIINQQVIQQLKPEQLERLEQLIAAELGENKGEKG